MAHDVFICHSSDDRQIADAVCHALESRGIRCWIAPRDVVLGTDWGEAIIEGLEDSRLMVLVFSSHANQSINVPKEVERAISKGLDILTFRVEDVPPSKKLEYHLSSLHWLDALTPPLERHIADLADTVKMLLARVTANPAVAGPAEPEEPPVVVEETAPSALDNEPGAAGSEQVEEAPAQQWAVARTLSGHPKVVSACAFSPDSQAVVSASYDNSLQLWDVVSGACRAVLAGHTRSVQACVFSPDGQAIASASYDKTVRLWDVASGTCSGILIGHERAVSACAFSPDGHTVVSVGEDDTLRLWDVASGTCRATLAGHGKGAGACAFSPDGDTVVSASDNNTLKLWDVDSGTCRAILTGHTGAIRACPFSPDGQAIVSASDDKTLRLWDVANGTCSAVLEGHWQSVRACAFSPDGRTIVSGSDDNTVRLWDVARGICRAILTGHTGSVLACAFSPDGQAMTSASDDKTIKLWAPAAAAGVARAVPPIRRRGWTVWLLTGGVWCILGGYFLTTVSAWYWLAAGPLFVVALGLMLAAAFMRQTRCPLCGKRSVVYDSHGSTTCGSCKGTYGF